MTNVIGVQQDPIETIAALLALAGDLELEAPDRFPGRLFRHNGVKGPVAVAGLPAGLASIRVEVAEPSPEGLGETWRIDFPVPTEVSLSANGERESLWVSAEVDPDAISLDDLRTLLGQLSERAETLNRSVTELSAAEQQATLLWEELASLGPGCSAVMRELGRGELLRPTGNRHGLLTRHQGWYEVGGYWPIPEPLTSLKIATRWLLGRTPPDCGNLLVDGDRIVIAGAQGWVALAVEDRTHQPPGEGSEHGFLSQLAWLLPRASKASSVVRESMPASEFGWLRPFLFEGSTLSGQGRVLCYRPNSGAMEEDPATSEAWRRLLRYPEDHSAADQLMSLLAPGVDQLLDGAWGTRMTGAQHQTER